MLEAIIVASRRPRARSFFSLCPRFGRAGLIASTATIVAAASVAAAGWNAPPGSALSMVRSVRQGVMLKLPGANDTALHLEFAEQSLADARERINPAQSLADATTELNAAYSELSRDASSPFWSRYRLDESTLLSEESGIESESPASLPTGTPRPTEDDTPRLGANPAEGDGSESPSSSSGHGSPSPTGGGGNDGGGPDP
jgi:uncharacterized membrane protein YgcG